MNCLLYYESLEILNSNIVFTSALDLLALITTNQDRFIKLYFNNFINMCVNIIRNRILNKKYFNIITNTFNIIFKRNAKNKNYTI